MGLSRDNLTTIAARTGCKVVAAWSGRNEGSMGEVYGVVMHHTGSAWGTAVAPTLKIVQEGRSDLQNALCTYYIDRAGTIYLITEKVAWHAGAGSWRGVTDGNGHLLGIEAESDGTNWTPETLESFVRLVAEICRFLGVDPNTWAIRHAQWAPTRKVDFSGYKEDAFRARVAARVAGIPAAPIEEDDFMALFKDLNEFMVAVNRATLCMTPSDRGGTPWLVDMVKGTDGNVGLVRNELAALRATVDTLAKAVAAKQDSIDETALLKQIDESIKGAVVKVSVAVDHNAA